MKIKNGTIKNLNKRLIVGALAFTLITIPLTGCDSISIDNLKYTTNEQESAGYFISYDSLKNCSFYKVYNNKTNEGYYTIALQDLWNESLLIKYYDIFTKEELTPSSFAIKSIDSVQNYLNTLDMIKEEYTEEELKEVLIKFAQLQQEDKNKKLVKE